MVGRRGGTSDRLSHGNDPRDSRSRGHDFDLGIARALEWHDSDHLVRALASDFGRLSHPTPDHYLPLLYAAGASTQDDAVRFPIEGFDMASLSMRSVILG